jgi:hypothetical protein
LSDFRDHLRQRGATTVPADFAAAAWAFFTA